MLRPFTWSDVAAIARIASEAQGVEGGAAPFSEREAEEYLRQPNLRPERDCFLADIEGAAAGYTLVVPELSIGRAIIEGAVSPSFRNRGVGESLLARGIAHARALGAAAVHVSASPLALATLRALEAGGFSEARRQWQMRLDVGADPPARPAFAYRARPMVAGEEPLMTEVQNRAFGGSWGFAPNTPAEIAYRVRMGGGRPEDTVFLVAADRPIAYCWTRMSRGPGGPCGIIWMIGVDPQAQGRGLGRAILEEGIESLRRRGARAVELTVYQDNAAALRLYRARGFRPVRETVWYEKRL